MANNSVPITPGAGANIAVDTIAGVDYQRVKVGYGDTGNYSDVAIDNPLPVQIAGSTQLTFNSGLPTPVTVVDGLSEPTTIPFEGLNAVYNATSTQWNQARDAGSGDGLLTGVPVAGSYLYDPNTNTWNGKRGNWDNHGSLIPNGTYAATHHTATQSNFNHKGAYIQFAVSAVGTDPLVLTIRGYIGGNWSGSTPFTIYTVSIPAVTDIYPILIYPNISASPVTGVIGVPLPLPKSWDIQVTHADSTNWTYYADVTYQE